MSRNFEKEVVFKSARSSGKGGQHVNKTETKVILLFNVEGSELLSDFEKQRILSKLKSQVNKEGILVIHSEKSRSQYLNKKEAIQKLNVLLQKALKVKVKRIPTKISARQKEKRLKEKKKHSEKKQFRKNPGKDV